MIAIKNNFRRAIAFLEEKNLDIAEAIENHYLDYVRDNVMQTGPGRVFGSILTNHHSLLPADAKPGAEVYTFCVLTVALDGGDCDILDCTVIYVDDNLISYGAVFQPTKH